MLVTEALFKSELGGIQSSLAFKTVEPFLKIADRTFKQKIGIELYNTLLVPTEELEELSNIARGIVSWSGFELAFPHLKMKAGDLGLMKSSPNNTVAITKWEYVDSKEAIVQMIDKLSEDFYELLEELAPQAWKESAAYKKRIVFLMCLLPISNELKILISVHYSRQRCFYSLRKNGRMLPS
jgi:hypothetical protein